MPLTNRRNQAGFSLIELLIVVAIILIIIAIAIPALQRAGAAADRARLMQITGIEAPTYDTITDEERRLISKPILDILRNCEADRNARIQQATRRYERARQATPQTPPESNAALVELAAAKDDLRKAESAQTCSSSDLSELRSLVKKYKLEASAPSS